MDLFYFSGKNKTNYYHKNWKTYLILRFFYSSWFLYLLGEKKTYISVLRFSKTETENMKIPTTPSKIKTITILGDSEYIDGPKTFHEQTFMLILFKN